MVPWPLLAFVLSLSTAADPATRVRYDGHKVVRVVPSDGEELRLVLELADDVWSERIGPGPVDVRIAPDRLPVLDASGIDYDVRIADVQTAVDTEAQRLQAAPGPQAVGAFFDDFKDYAAVDGYLDTLHAEAPDITAVTVVGQSLEGRDIRALEIGAPASGKAAVMFTGTMHAREWLATMTTTCIADRFVRDYGTDPHVTELVDALDIYVIPIINPDGYVHSWQSDRYWRKNRREGYGVDLNRNWGHGWGGQGASTNPYDETYRGAGPFSEPETQVVRDFMAARPELVAHIDFHSYAELIIYPWGCCYESAPDEMELSSIAQNLSGAMQGVHGRYYQPIQGADFYPAAGAVDDWSYGEQDLRAFTIELRGNDFVISPSAIEPTCEESFAAVLELADWAMQFSEVDPGPETGTGGPDPGHTSGPGGHTSGPMPPDPGPTTGAPPGGPGDLGTTGAVAESGGIAEGSEDDGGGGLPDPGALPPGFGERSEAGCGCSARAGSGGFFWLVGLWMVSLRTRARLGQGTQ